jgi:hypothetical protein
MTGAIARQRTVPRSEQYQNGSPAPAEKRADDHVARFRPHELKRLILDRYGRRKGIITPDDGGFTLAAAMLDALALGANAGDRMEDFLQRHCVWMGAADREAVAEAAIARRKCWWPSELGDALKLTPEERKRLRITTFRAAGMDDAAMEAKRKASKAAAGKAKRESERLHPAPKKSKPALRLEAIMNILPAAGEWVSVAVVSSELKRRKVFHFASVTGKTLTSAVHDAISLGIETGAIEKRIVDGARLKVAQICKRRCD